MEQPHEHHDGISHEPFSIQEYRKHTLFLSGAIILAAIIIGVSILYAGSIFSPLAGTKTPDAANGISAQVKDILSIQSDDYVWGNKDAPVKLFEFSDLECPYCKQFHDTLSQVMSTYGTSGKVAVIYRHFPLDSIHPKARHEAEAAECAGSLGGNESFWKYVNRLFDITPSNNGFDPAQLPQIANFVGLDQNKFSDCLNKEPFAEKITKQQQEGITLGAQGTPYSVVINKSGKTFVINGSQDITSVRGILDVALKNN